jgi:hypothetical protein
LKVVIFGLGYVGCTAAGCIASQGHSVTGIDVSQAKVDAINAGRSPVHEPGLEDLIASARREGLLDARKDIGDALESAELAIVCVGTPSGVDGAHNMGFITDVTRQIALAVAGRGAPLSVAYRSTMRPGTTEQLIWPIFRSALGDRCDEVIKLVYNPEFLREASAIADYFAPPKIVIGTLDGQPSATMDKLHEGIAAPTFHVGIREAEVTKFVDNTSRYSRFRCGIRRCCASRLLRSCSRRARPSPRSGRRRRLDDALVVQDSPRVGRGRGGLRAARPRELLASRTGNCRPEAVSQLCAADHRPSCTRDGQHERRKARDAASRPPQADPCRASLYPCNGRAS